MGINRVSTYLPFTLGVLLRRAASTTLVYRADAVTPCRSVRTGLVSSFVLRSSLLFPRFAFSFFFFSFFHRRRPNRDIPWQNNIADHVFRGRNASPRPRYRCAASSSTGVFYPAPGECLTNPYPYASSATWLFPGSWNVARFDTLRRRGVSRSVNLFRGIRAQRLIIRQIYIKIIFHRRIQFF